VGEKISARPQTAQVRKQKEDYLLDEEEL